MLSDVITFWAKHRERPPLVNPSYSFTGGQKRERMLDDGSIVWVEDKSITAIIDQHWRATVSDLTTEQSQFWDKMTRHIPA